VVCWPSGSYYVANWLRDTDTLPQKVWHNVPMSHAAYLPASAPPFTFGWKDVERGLPLATLEQFSAYSGIPVKELLEVVIPPRTLKHRRQRQEPLSVEESDRLARVARMFELAAKVYGDRDEGRDWLLSSMRRFDEKTALSMLRTEAGGQAVQEFLIQIDEGMFA
jgi:putative toxin-antitoxin system antitoxin component (TIGR02293 family)